MIKGKLVKEPELIGIDELAYGQMAEIVKIPKQSNYVGNIIIKHPTSSSRSVINLTEWTIWPDTDGTLRDAKFRLLLEGEKVVLRQYK